jgi:hypothetical protein
VVVAISRRQAASARRGVLRSLPWCSLLQGCGGRQVFPLSRRSSSFRFPRRRPFSARLLGGRLPAGNSHHHAVIQALQADGWTIAHDPLLIPYGDRRRFIDRGAERPTIGAERGSERSAVEIASFVADSPVRDLQEAVGQFVVYRALLAQTEPERTLFLAVSTGVQDSVLSEPLGQLVAADVRLRVLVFDPHQQKEVRWINETVIARWFAD